MPFVSDVAAVVNTWRRPDKARKKYRCAGRKIRYACIEMEGSHPPQSCGEDAGSNPDARLGGRSMAINPRSSNGNLRRKHRARFKAMGAPCGICGGRLGPIHYEEPSSSEYPFSFVIDEIRPVSRWKEFGYTSKAAAAQDWNNFQAAHWCCNAAKSNKTNEELKRIKKPKRLNLSDGRW